MFGVFIGRVVLSSPREDIAAALESKLSPEQLTALMDEVLVARKGARGWCPSCKKHVQVEISDAKAVVSAMTDLLSQAYGRPKEQEKSEGGIVVNRTVVFEGAS